MRIFVTGATGVLGRRVVDRLVQRGDAVTAIARSAAKAAQLDSRGATSTPVSLFDSSALAEAFDGHEVVLNLATAVPPMSKATRAGAWDDNQRIRTVGSEAVATAAAEAGVGRLVQESLAYAYADGGDEVLDEDSPLDVPDHGVGIIEAEAAVERFRTSGGTGVVLRFGNFHAPDADHTQAQLQMASRGVLPLLGADGAWWPAIHVDDAAAAVIAALDAADGIYNAAAQPATRQQIAAAYASALGKRKVRRPPTVMAKLGPSAGEMLTRSQRVSSQRLRDATGWRPEYDNIEDLIRACLPDEPT